MFPCFFVIAFRTGDDIGEVVASILKLDKADGSFRSRRLHLGWDNVPMHRWGQSQMFRSLSFYLLKQRKVKS